MNHPVRNKLIEVAKSGLCITYQELSDQCKLGLEMKVSKEARLKMGRILDEITIMEFKNGRPMLSAVVITSLNGIPGIGFYHLCESLGLGNALKLQKDRAFYKKQLDLCRSFWSDEKNYLQFKELA